MRVAIAAVDEVPHLFEAIAAGNREEAKASAARIFEHEEEADKIKNELRRHLPRTMLLPVNRRDLLDVLDMQDSIADVAQDIGGLVIERSMTIPDPLRVDLPIYIDKCVEVCHLAGKIIEELDELLETGFRGREATAVETMIEELNQLEDESDDLGDKLGRILFQHEDDMKPVSVIFWYRLIEWIGDLADYSEKVGNRLRLLIAS